MLRHLLIRLALLPPILLLANAAGFTFAQLVQHRRLLANLAEGEPAPPAPPLAELYGSYLAGLLRGDLGPLPYGGRDTLGALVWPAAWASLGLLALALVLSIVVGLLLGVRAVRHAPPAVSLWLTAFATFGLATPAFYLGSVLIAAALLYVIYGPGTGTDLPIPVQGFGWDAHLILPTLVLMILPTAKIAQVTASLLADELGKQYVVAARSVGHSWRTIIRRLALRNVLAPVIATAAGLVPLLIGELLIVERIFSWPGLGQLMARVLIPPAVVQARTAPLFLHPPTLALVLTIFAVLFVLIDLLASSAARLADPRLRV